FELRNLPRDLRFAFRVLTGGGGTSAGDTIGDVQRLPYENSREETDSTEPCDPLQLFAAVFHRMPLPSLIAKDPGGSDVPSFLAGLEMFRPALSYDITQREGTGRKTKNRHFPIREVTVFCPKGENPRRQFIRSASVFRSASRTVRRRKKSTVQGG